MKLATRIRQPTAFQWYHIFTSCHFDIKLDYKNRTIKIHGLWEEHITVMVLKYKNISMQIIWCWHTKYIISSKFSVELLNFARKDDDPSKPWPFLILKIPCILYKITWYKWKSSVSTVCTITTQCKLVIKSGICVHFEYVKWNLLKVIISRYWLIL